MPGHLHASTTLTLRLSLFLLYFAYAGQSADVRSLNETCGTTMAEQCDHGLECFRPGGRATGICIDQRPKHCAEADCPLPPSCPSDSSVALRPPSSNECCPPEAQCRCDLHQCHGPILCEAGSESFLVRAGTKQPGDCCDEYACREKGLRCGNVKCPTLFEAHDLYTLEDGSCPEDSFRPVTYVPKGSCCPIIPLCQCRPSVCQPVHCPEGELVVFERRGLDRPGKCCDKFHCVKLSSSNITGLSVGTPCTHDGRTYEDGAEWNQEPCMSCSCNGGVALCKRMQCPKMSRDCNWVGIPENECCPICLGCKDDAGVNRKNDDSWVKDDCTNCTCVDFRAQCQRHICKVDCENPRKVPGQCCPVCDEPTIVEPPVICGSVELCPLRCEYGLHRNEIGCFTCECAKPLEDRSDLQTTSAECMPLTEHNCERQCAHGYLHDSRGCPVCKCAKCPPIDQCYKHCLYGFETNLLGCPVCKCRPKSKISARLLINDRYLHQQLDSCVSVSPDGRGLVERDSGEWWSDRHCRTCFCQQRTEYCSLISCPSRPDSCSSEHWAVKKGHCCASCTSDPTTAEPKHSLTVCHSPGTGRIFVDGETWQLSECIACTCRVGHVLCSSTECPPLACDNAVADPNNRCCAKCPDSERSSEPTIASEEAFCTDEVGVAHAIGDSWRLDECKSCRCSAEGDVTCFTEKCHVDEKECQGKLLTVKAKCCPICSDSLENRTVCRRKQAVYTVNEEFRDGPCRNCSCREGNRLECTELQCPFCQDPVPVAGQCCPICRDTETYSFGEGAPPTTVFIGDHGVRIDTMKDEHSWFLILLLAVLTLLLLGLCIVVAVFLARLVRNQRSVLKPKPGMPMRSEHSAQFPKIRNTSESESANVSLLSAHTDSSTAGSSTCGSDHGDHSPVGSTRLEVPKTTTHHDVNIVIPIRDD